MEERKMSYGDLKRLLKYEKSRYFPNKPYNRFYIFDYFLSESYSRIWRYQKLLRKSEYLYAKRKNPVFALLYLLWGRRKNKAGSRLGIYIPEFVFEEGLLIDHYGSITVNGRCKIGKNCRLHGNNCIGNKGAGRENEFPVIGNDFDLGFGSVVIGNVKIANHVVVGANAVVTRDCLTEEAVLVGIPARQIK